jgi:hypothetical protein
MGFALALPGENVEMFTQCPDHKLYTDVLEIRN